MIAFELPIELVSLNKLQRMHRNQKSALVADQRELARRRTHGAIVTPPTWPLLVTITRVRPKGKLPLDRWDNLPGSAKYVLDGVCLALGIDDNDERLEVRFRQEVGATWATRVRVESLGTEAIVRVVPKVRRAKRRAA